MSDIEINEDNCVLDSFELTMIELACEEYAGRFTLITEKLGAACLKITKLNEMAKELHTRNLSVKTIIKFHDIGKQAEEKQNERG